MYELFAKGDTKTFKQLPEEFHFEEVESTEELNIDMSSRTKKMVSAMRRKSPGNYKGLGLFSENSCIGYGWVIFKGGQNPEYKVVNADCYICRCFIDPAYRGNGLFKYLIKEMIDRYCPVGRIAAAIRPDNVASRRSFEALGFTVCGERRYHVLSVFGVLQAIPHHKI